MLPNLHTKLILSNMMMKNRFHLSLQLWNHLFAWGHCVAHLSSDHLAIFVRQGANYRKRGEPEKKITTREWGEVNFRWGVESLVGINRVSFTHSKINV